MQKTYFKEEQRFTQPWLWLVLIVSISGGLIPIIVGLYAELIQGKPFGDNPTSGQTMIIMFFVVMTISVGIVVLFWKTKMITVVRDDGLIIKFPPFFLREKSFSPDTFAEYTIRQYRPIREYGGWGIRRGLGKHGKAYNVKGKSGLQLVFKSGNRLLIGTQRGDALMRAMNKMMKEE